MGCGGSKDRNTDAPNSEIPNRVDADTQKQRKKQLEAARKMYEYVYTDFMPPHVKGLPKDEIDLPGTKRVVDIFGKLDSTTAKIKFNWDLDTFNDFFKPDTDPYKDYLDVLPGDMTFQGYKREIPKVAATWKTDEEFALQRIAGFNPFVIKKFEAFVDKFPVNDEMLDGILPAGQTLESLMKASRLYWCDYPFLEGVPCKKGEEQYLCAPIGLFFVDDEKKLMPAAIQLQQDPKKSPIFTPKDPAWFVAKIHYQIADVMTHELAWHLTSSHLIPETIYVAARRNLAAIHPLLLLLQQHFWFTLVVNFAARTVLVNEDGMIPKMFPVGFEGQCAIGRYFNEHFDWDAMCPSKDLNDMRKLSEMPNFYYRDDALELYNVIETYCREWTSAIYLSDKEVADDYELQAWVAECKQLNSQWKNMPYTDKGTIETREVLTYFLATLIFTVSARHAATNNGQFDMMGFVPNTPATLKVVPPTDKNQSYTDEEIVRGMPKKDMTALQVSLMATLSTPVNEGYKLGQYDEDYKKSRSELKPIISKFQASLKTLETKITERNAKVPHPYLYLNPGQISQGVDI